MIYFLTVPAPQRIGHPVLGVIIPALILLVSFISTWLLYRYFTRQ
jgi:hypothetical protein